MFDLKQLAGRVADMARNYLPVIKGAPEAVETVKALGGLISCVKHFADPPTRAELDKLEAEVLGELDDTIAKLGG
jgi:hypothetical protein